MQCGKFKVRKKKSIKSKSNSYLESLTISLLIKSLASSDMSSKRSSGKSNLHCEILQKVSCLVSPPKGEHPVRRTYNKTPTDHISVARLIAS